MFCSINSRVIAKSAVHSIDLFVPCDRATGNLSIQLNVNTLFRQKVYVRTAVHRLLSHNLSSKGEHQDRMNTLLIVSHL